MKEKIKKVVFGFASIVLTVIMTSILSDPILLIYENITNGILTSITDTFYYYCARCSELEFVNYILFILANYLCIAYPTHYISDIRKPSEAERQRKIESEIKGKTSEELKELVQKSSNRLKYLKKVASAAVVLLTITQIMFLIFTAGYVYMPTQYKLSFDRQITKITPYVDSHEIDLLKSDWTLMESKEDYTAIMDRINLVIEENNLN